MQAEYKPKKVFPDGSIDTELKMQANTRRQANKYFGPSEIISGEELLLHRVRRIGDRLQQIVFRVCGLSPAIAHCEKVDAERRKEEYSLSKKWEEEEKGGENRWQRRQVAATLRALGPSAKRR
ncbi:hypothetical protein [Dysosmobacter welbionis]|uniref:hypothetical protein n=1 Tax=Dysosmobacter welbionis TaxID=2093857 RepID=UPI00300F6676